MPNSIWFKALKFIRPVLQANSTHIKGLLSEYAACLVCCLFCACLGHTSKHKRFIGWTLYSSGFKTAHITLINGLDLTSMAPKEAFLMFWTFYFGGICRALRVSCVHPYGTFSRGNNGRVALK